MGALVYTLLVLKNYRKILASGYTEMIGLIWMICYELHYEYHSEPNKAMLRGNDRADAAAGSDD